VPRGSETITVLAVVADEDTDWQGDPLDDAEEPEEFGEDGSHPEYELKGCIVWSPSTDDRPDMVISSRGVFVPTGNVPPDPHDALMYDGAEWSIDGDVGPHRKKSGRLLGWQFAMRRVT
jgi:hypothetical protein